MQIPCQSARNPAHAPFHRAWAGFGPVGRTVLLRARPLPAPRRCGLGFARMPHCPGAWNGAC